MNTCKYLFFLLPAIYSSHASVGDIINFNAAQSYNIDGVVTRYVSGYLNTQNIESSRLYDSTKGQPWAKNETTNLDSAMCWLHAGANSLQYWQDVYGVFYKDNNRTLPNGSNNTITVSERLTDGTDRDNVVISNPKNLNIAKNIYENWNGSQRDGGFFSDASDWYLKEDSSGEAIGTGSYFSAYFSDTPTHITRLSTYGENIINNTSIETSSGYSPFSDTLAGIKEALLPAFGFEKNSDNTYTQLQDGIMPTLGIWNKGNNVGHYINCQGFRTDENGNLVSLIIADNNTTSATKGLLSEVYLKENNGVVMLYRDSACTKLYNSGNTGTNYYIAKISYINTPEVLRNMLIEYRDTKEAAVWNGASSTWETQVDVVDSNIADSSTGWDILINGDNIDEAHHGYYHGYALDGRDIEFGDHANAANRQVTIQGTVSARNIEVTAAGYQFLKGTDAAITATLEASSLNIRSGASLTSELAFNERSLLIENGASLTLTNVNELRLTNVSLHSGSAIEATTNSTIYVTGAFSTTQGTSVASLYSLRNTIIPEASVNANLDLSTATSISLECMVNMNGFDLYLNSQTPITLNLLEGGDTIPFFTNIGELYLDNALLSDGTDLTEVLTLTNWANYANYSLIYSSGTLGLVIPEPTTSTLSMLGLALLLIKRKRA
ncbi:MAG: hypothetical protein Q4C05_03285 [Akkermansia sp.]|nr:hypothetical protein [Akkermansia sp.]